MKLSLVVGQGTAKGRLIPISLPQFVIGRDSKCHLRPVSQTISKRHCELLIREDRAFVKDLGSTNGTFVNDQQVRGERELNDGDVLKVGPLDFGVRIEAAAAVEAQVEKPTQVEKETQAPPPPAPKAPAKPAPKVVQPKLEAKADALDEDAVGSLLLELTEGEEVNPNDSLSGSTIMEVLQPQADDEKGKQPYRPQVNKSTSSENTSSAAKAILEKYRRRPRS
jgi:predicted component of type VI protein secretion system